MAEIPTVFGIEILLLSVEGADHAGLADHLADGADLAAPLVEGLAAFLLEMKCACSLCDDVVRLRLDESLQNAGQTAGRTRLQIGLERIQRLQRKVVLLVVDLALRDTLKPHEVHYALGEEQEVIKDNDVLVCLFDVLVGLLQGYVALRILQRSTT